MDDFSLKMGKLILEAENDRISGDAFIAQPEKELAEKLGVIFGIVELIEQPDYFTDRFFGVIDDLKTEYYLPPLETEYGLEKRLEECFQRANRRIAKALNESVERINPRNINVVVGLVQRNKIHLGQIGKIPSLAFHQKKKYDYAIVDIFEAAGEKKEKLNPEKMFSNIVSGALTAKDDLLFLNEAVLKYLSQNNLLEILSENTPASAAREIQEELKKNNDNFYLIIGQPEEFQPIPAEKSSPLRREGHPKNSLNELITTQEKTEQYLTPSLKPNWKKIIILIFLGFKKIIRLVGTGLKILIEKTADGLARLGPWLKKNIPRFIQTGGRAGRELSGDPKNFLKNTSQQFRTAAKKIGRRTIEFDQSRYQKIITDQSTSSGNLGKISDWLNRQIAKFLSLNRFQQILIIIAALGIFGFSQSVVWQGRHADFGQKKEITEIIQEIKEKINTAEAQNIFNDEAGAEKSLAEARALLAEIPEQKKYRDQREMIHNQINQLEEALKKISYLENPELVADLNQRDSQAVSAGLVKAGNRLFVFNNHNQILYQINLAQGGLEARQLPENLSQIEKISAINEETIILLNNGREFYRYRLKENTAEKILNLEESIADFDLYQEKIYTLRPDQNQIYKHLKTSTGYNSGQPWIQDGSNISQMGIIAIDGGIYLAGKNGTINYFMAGRSQEADFSEIAPLIKQPDQLFSRLESKYLYLLDRANQRVVIFNKNGNLKIQYSSKKFNRLKAMAVAESEKKIYLLSDNKIYSIPINF